MRRHLVAALVALPAAVVTVLGLPPVMQQGEEALRELAHTCVQQARKLSGTAAKVLAGNDRESLRAQIAEHQNRTGGRAHVFDARGRSVDGALCILSPAQVSQQDPVQAALRGQYTDSADQKSAQLADELVVAVPVIWHGLLIGVVVICSALDDLELQQMTIWVVVGVTAAFALALSRFLAELLARWILRPVRYIETAARRFAAGDHDVRVPVHLGPPDLRVLAETFNHVAEQVQQQVKLQRSFVSDASHQLRSPLVALRLRLENLEPHVTPEGERRLEQALGEADRMTGILNALLLLARAESGAQPAEAVDVRAVAEERVASWRVTAELRHVAVVIEGEVDVVVSAIAGTVDQILDVFLDNAVRASPQHTTIRVRLVEDDGVVSVQCQDAGPGMSPDERARACDRFWRGPNAITSEGSGLGLAIASSLAQANHGHLLLQEAPGGGLHAEVRLPALRPAQPTARLDGLSQRIRR
ncbi:sensor histidine kinase [Streptomyces sp. NPDC060027]|uniref:sensor histidine kinase n=1 Tax=Streptomyces sp. NPDC060027 TaxID=3347040 RepID=UPI00367C3C28